MFLVGVGRGNRRRLDRRKPRLAPVGENEGPAVDDADDLTGGDRVAAAGRVGRLGRERARRKASRPRSPTI
jgi:hypothetical protein